MFEYFCNINILRFILYSATVCNYSQIHSEDFFYVRGFFPQGFSHKFDVFLWFRISLLCH